MSDFEFKTFGEVSIWARNMEKAFDEFRKTGRLMVLGIFGTCGATLLEIVLKAIHVI